MELLRKANEDLLLSQTRDDTQLSLILIENKIVEKYPKQGVQQILKAEKFRLGREWIHRLLVKYEGLIELTWKNRCDLEIFETLSKFEAKFGKGHGVDKMRAPIRDLDLHF